MRNHYPNKDIEEIEIYISNNNDTIINQYKYYSNTYTIISFHLVPT